MGDFKIFSAVPLSGRIKMPKLLLIVHFVVGIRTCRRLTACPKKTTQQRSGERKGSQSLVRLWRISCAARNNRALRNSLRSNSPRAYPVISVLLGCVKWHKKQHSAVNNFVYTHIPFSFACLYNLSHLLIFFYFQGPTIP